MGGGVSWLLLDGVVLLLSTSGTVFCAQPQQQLWEANEQFYVILHHQASILLACSMHTLL